LILPDSLCLVASPDVAGSVDDTFENLYHQPFIIDNNRLIGEKSLDITGLATEHAIEVLKLNKMKLDASRDFRSTRP